MGWNIKQTANGKRQQTLSGVYQNIKEPRNRILSTKYKQYILRSLVLFNHQVFPMLQAMRKIKLTINLYSWSDSIMMLRYLSLEISKCYLSP